MKYETIVCPFCGNGHAHITYEGNWVYQMNCPDCNNAIFHRDTSWDNSVSFFKRMVVTDESELRQQEHFREVTKKVEPLTMDALREMDKASEPVYLYIFRSDIDGGWQIIEQITDRKIIFRGSMGIYVPIKELGVSYNLYRQKPEEWTV